MKFPSLVYPGLIALGLFAASTTVSAQSFDVGKSIYLNHCAACHGESGKGNGPVAKQLKSAVSDLTILSKGNPAGMFPVNHVWGVIDGRALVAAHGTRGMPVWGDVFADLKRSGYYGPMGARANTQDFINGRILALMGYLESIQQK